MSRTGQTYRETESRNYTEGGVRKTHVRTTEWRITEDDGRVLSAVAVGIVSETDRPSFAGDPETTTLLASSYERWLASGEIVES